MSDKRWRAEGRINSTNIMHVSFVKGPTSRLFSLDLYDTDSRTKSSLLARKHISNLAIYPIFYLFHIVTSVVGPTAIAAAHLHFSLTIQQSDQRVAFKQPDLVKLATSWQLDPRNQIAVHFPSCSCRLALS